MGLSEKSIVRQANLTPAEYSEIHRWVYSKLGMPKECWHCGDTKKARYEWSNKSNKYLKSIDDWERLCRSCHSKKDAFYRNHNETKKNHSLLQVDLDPALHKALRMLAVERGSSIADLIRAQIALLLLEEQEPAAKAYYDEEGR